MDSFQKMRARDRVISNAAVGDAARAVAVYDAGVAVDEARRMLKRARASEQVDATSARRTGISPEEQKAVAAVAASSRNVEEATSALEFALTSNANVLIELESLQTKLATAEAELKRALEVRQEVKERLGQTDARTGAAQRANDARGIPQTDWVASDAEVAELDSVEGCIKAQVDAFERFARKQLTQRT
jgi:hypothetical protein